MLIDKIDKFFNTAGPVNKDFYYKIDPLKRWDMEAILDLIKMQKYFVLHAPRQTGKTSCLLELRDYLNAEGKYFAVYANIEAAQANMYDVQNGIQTVVSVIQGELLKLKVEKSITDEVYKLIFDAPHGQCLSRALTYISEHIPKPVIFFIDEIDALIGDTLISVLRQLRSGYLDRPVHFPSTIVLCGVRDVKDYRIQTYSKEIVTGGSAFNVKTESLRLGNFSLDDVVNLYTQHTTETGQQFDPDCYDLIMNYTNGQPWLVNALAYEATHRMKENRVRSITITPDILAEAKERLILKRETHLDQLTDKLAEDRVRRVMLPMILGDDYDPTTDDKDYCIDLGLIKKTSEGYQISNMIYQEIIIRVLTDAHQDNFLARFRPNWITEDGRLDIIILLNLFKDYWYKNSEVWASQVKGYQEAAPHLLLHAFLQRVVNGGGRITREYALGRKRTDLLIEWFYDKKIQNIVLEIKTVRKKQKYESVLAEAITQTVSYAKRCGKNEAHIIIFDKDYTQNWSADEQNEYAKHDGVKVEVWKMGGDVDNCS